ncbi:MAG: HisS family protein [Candidatus Nanoarchaeia archaeon]|nr:HisS family protein [Candidatus Nanoarchaeia archaeon]MDD5357789.1 HisS family protein [Candidatus Nanoarchaeia archaeon]MDD5588708.1 HisS family protein [Candidatus Nanoarchaeia archaeon]
MNTEIVKGFRDYTGEDAEKKSEIKKILVETFEKYGFEPAETPIIENEEFVRGENKEDEAVSDIYKLKDKGNRNLALRYEFTFQLKRIAKNKKLPYKRYEIGEVFRDEPVSSNRFRQFTQCDVDIVGSSVKEEAEILSLANEVMKKIGVKPSILINNRNLLNEILESEGIKAKEQVLREIDKFGKLPEKEILENLKKYKAEKILSLLKKGESYFSKFESYKRILELMKYCNYYGVKVLFSPTIIRGLSYYNGSVFEIKTDKIKETICAGGSYMINGIQASGISFGLDRLVQLAKLEIEKEKYLVISLDKDKDAVNIVKRLREKNKIAEIYYGKPTKALEYANSYKINKVIFVGEKEVKAKKFKIKDMTSGKEKSIDLSTKF